MPGEVLARIGQMLLAVIDWLTAVTGPAAAVGVPPVPPGPRWDDPNSEDSIGLDRIHYRYAAGKLNGSWIVVDD